MITVALGYGVIVDIKDIVGPDINDTNFDIYCDGFFPTEKDELLGAWLDYLEICGRITVLDDTFSKIFIGKILAHWDDCRYDIFHQTMPHFICNLTASDDYVRDCIKENVIGNTSEPMVHLFAIER